MPPSFSQLRRKQGCCWDERHLNWLGCFVSPVLPMESAVLLTVIFSRRQSLAFMLFVQVRSREKTNLDSVFPWNISGDKEIESLWAAVRHSASDMKGWCLQEMWRNTAMCIKISTTLLPSATCPPCLLIPAFYLKVLTMLISSRQM